MLSDIMSKLQKIFFDSVFYIANCKFTLLGEYVFVPIFSSIIKFLVRADKLTPDKIGSNARNECLVNVAIL